MEEQANTPISMNVIMLEIKKKARIHNPDPDAHIRNLLVESPYLGYASHQDTLIPTRTLYKNLSFRIQPTPHEIKFKILIPGHRLLPYTAPDIAPHELRFYYKRKKVRWKTHRDSIEDLMLYFNLISQTNLMHFITPLPEGSPGGIPLVDTEVLDLSAFYEETNFKSGEQVNVNILDYDKGRFNLTRVTREELLMERKAMVAQDKKLIEYLNNELKNLPPRFPCEPLLNAQSALYMDQLQEIDQDGEGTPAVPYSPYGPLLNNNDLIELDFFNPAGVLTLVPSGVSADEFYAAYFDAQTFRQDGRCENLDDLFEIAGLSLNESMVRAYIMDGLAFGDKKPATILERMFNNLRNIAWNEHQKSLFYDFFMDIFNRQFKARHENNNPETAKLRHKILASMDRHLEFLRLLDSFSVGLDELPGDEMSQLLEIDTMFSALLDFMERAADDEFAPADVTDMNEKLDYLEAARLELTRKAEKSLGIKT